MTAVDGPLADQKINKAVGFHWVRRHVSLDPVLSQFSAAKSQTASDFQLSLKNGDGRLPKSKIHLNYPQYEVLVPLR